MNFFEEIQPAVTAEVMADSYSGESYDSFESADNSVSSD